MKTIHYVAAGIILVVLFGMARYAFADGCEPGMRCSAKDEPAYSAAPRKAAIYAYQVKPSRLTMRCPIEIRERWPRIKDAECAKIAAMDAQRRKGVRRVQYERPAKRIVEREVYTIRDTDRRRTCQSAVPETSEERGSRDRALSSLEGRWRTAVSNAYGFRYVGIGNARGYDPDCNIIRKNKFGWPIWVCHVVARPCRSL